MQSLPLLKSHLASYRVVIRSNPVQSNRLTCREIDVLFRLYSSPMSYSSLLALVFFSQTQSLFRAMHKLLRLEVIEKNKKTGYYAITLKGLKIIIAIEEQLKKTLEGIKEE